MSVNVEQPFLFTCYRHYVNSVCWILSIGRFSSSSQFTSYSFRKRLIILNWCFNILSASAGELPVLKIIDSFFLEPSVSENDHRALILMSGSCIPPSISDIRFWWQWRHILYDCPGSTGRPSNIIALCCKNKCLMNTRGDKMRVVSTLSGKKANRFWWSPLFFIELIWKILYPSQKVNVLFGSDVCW